MDFFYQKKFSLLFYIAALLMLTSPEVFGQKNETKNILNTKETINIVDISKQSSEAILDTRQIEGRLISRKELLKKKRKVDSLINVIDLQIRKDKKVDLRSEEIRKLQTNLIFLQQEQSIIGKEKDELSVILNNLVENKNILSKKRTHWLNIKEAVKEKKMGKATEKSVYAVISTLNSTLLSISRLSNMTMGMTGNISSLELEISARVSEINNVMKQKQGELLSAKQKSLFALDYTNNKNWAISETLSQFYKVDLKNLKNYISLNIEILIFHILLIIILIIVFFKLSKTAITFNRETGWLYKKLLKQVLARPISAALIVGLFLSVILYTNQPLIFGDLVLFLAITPMVILLTGIFESHFRIYIYALAIVLLTRLIYSYFPATNIFSRYLLLFIAIVELSAVIGYIIQFKSLMLKQKKTGRLVFGIAYFAILLIITGLVGNIFGKVMLTRYLLFSLAGIAFITFLIILTDIMVNGFLVLFINSKLANKSNFVRKNRINLLRKIPRFFNFIAALILGYYILKILGWYNAVIGSVNVALTHQYNIGSVTFTWGRLFIFVFVIWLSVFLAKIIRAVLEEDILDKVDMEEGLPHTIAMMARYALITFGVLFAMSAAGVPLNDFAIIFGAMSVGIGFGLQNIFNNLVSGLILLFERPIKIGDTIEVGTLTGTVRSIGIRASNIRTFDGAEIIVPNGNLISNEVINWTLSDKRRRIEILVGVSYDADPRQVKEVLLDLLKKEEDVVDDPAPAVFFIEFGESSLSFRILFWTSDYSRWYRIRSEMYYKVFDTLKAAGITIPYPQMDVHFRSTGKRKSSKEYEQDNSDLTV